MDVILFLLNLATRLALAATGAVVAVVVFVLNKLTGHVARKAEPGAPRQERQPPARPREPEPAPAAAPVVPAVHVHVHLDREPASPAPSPVPASAPPMASGNQAPATVLSRPDHRIYVTTGSHLMMEHPDCDELLERLDGILYAAAHRNGDPFPVAPPLDDARPGHQVPVELPPRAAVDEDEFFSGERQTLPPPDGALWLRKNGELRRL